MSHLKPLLALQARQHRPLAALLELECSERSTRLCTYRTVTSRSLHNPSPFLPRSRAVSLA